MTWNLRAVMGWGAVRGGPFLRIDVSVQGVGLGWGPPNLAFPNLLCAGGQVTALRATGKNQYDNAGQAFGSPEGEAWLRDTVTVIPEGRMRENKLLAWRNVGETEAFFQNPGFQCLGILVREEHTSFLSPS